MNWVLGKFVFDIMQFEHGFDAHTCLFCRMFFPMNDVKRTRNTILVHRRSVGDAHSL